MHPLLSSALCYINVFYILWQPCSESLEQMHYKNQTGNQRLDFPHTHLTSEKSYSHGTKDSVQEVAKIPKENERGKLFFAWSDLYNTNYYFQQAISAPQHCENGFPSFLKTCNANADFKQVKTNPIPWQVSLPSVSYPLQFLLDF